MDQKISIVLPNYNGSKYIERAIESFLDQNYIEKELIIVDGKSTDVSHEIILKYSSTHKNIKWIKEPDVNVTDAINIGIKHCNGDFIAFLGSDVFYFSEDIFSTINEKFKKIPFDLVYFDYYHYEPLQSSIALMKSPNVRFNKANLLIYGTIAGFDNVFVSRKIYQRYKYDPNYNLCSDWEFFLRITEENLLTLYIETPCTVNLQDGTNLSKKYAELQMNQIREVGEKYNDQQVVPYYLKFTGNSAAQTPTKYSTFARIKRLIRKIVRKIIMDREP